MSKKVPTSQKKRKLEDGMKGKLSRPPKKLRRQYQYHSSSEDEDGKTETFAPVNLNDSDDEEVKAPMVKTHAKTQPKRRKLELPVVPDGTDDDSGSDNDSEDREDAEDAVSQDSGADVVTSRKTSKRNDPEAFSTSISKILSTKLSQSARKDPVLSRSRDAADTSAALANERLEHRARAKLRAEKKEDLQRGRVRDVTGLATGKTGEVAEEETRLRKVAQRGVVKLFNAVRAAQVRGEQALREERKKGTVGLAHREEKVNEMSKQGFLDLISGKKNQPDEA